MLPFASNVALTRLRNGSYVELLEFRSMRQTSLPPVRPRIDPTYAFSFGSIRVLGSRPLVVPFAYSECDLLKASFVLLPRTNIGVRTITAGMFSIATVP